MLIIFCFASIKQSFSIWEWVRPVTLNVPQFGARNAETEQKTFWFQELIFNKGADSMIRNLPDCEHIFAQEMYARVGDWGDWKL